MVIRGIHKVSLVDFPGNICATVFVSGCNMRCPYCHNRDLVLEPEGLPAIAGEEVLEFMVKRKGLLDGVCITGGEPTLQKDISIFTGRVKEMGFKVKLDTNGSNPRVLGQLLKSGLLDYVAMDIKAPPDRYREVTRSRVNPEDIQASVYLLMTGNIDYEFRTTVVPGLITEEYLLSIAGWLAGARKYVLQQYKPGAALEAAFAVRHPYDACRLKAMAERVEGYFTKVEVRGASGDGS
ncbi:MAG: anaerobic ribonucleoside-triphosphate reductase activating protein [Bacillota bacterium]